MARKKKIIINNNNSSSENCQSTDDFSYHGSHLKCKGLSLYHSLQDHKAVGSHIDIAAVLDLIPHVWIHTLTQNK